MVDQVVVMAEASAAVADLSVPTLVLRLRHLREAFGPVVELDLLHTANPGIVRHQASNLRRTNQQGARCICQHRQRADACSLRHVHHHTTPELYIRLWFIQRYQGQGITFTTEPFGMDHDDGVTTVTVIIIMIMEKLRMDVRKLFTISLQILPIIAVNRQTTRSDTKKNTLFLVFNEKQFNSQK